MPIPWEDRDELPNDDERLILQLYANQPGYCRSRKPAVFLLMFADGATFEEISHATRKGLHSMERWWRLWEEDGIPSLYHMTLPDWVFSGTRPEPNRSSALDAAEEET